MVKTPLYVYFGGEDMRNEIKRLCEELENGQKEERKNALKKKVWRVTVNIFAVFFVLILAAIAISRKS